MILPKHHAVIQVYHIHNSHLNANNRKILSFAQVLKQSRIPFWKILYVQLSIMDAQISLISKLSTINGICSYKETLNGLEQFLIHHIISNANIWLKPMPV